MLHIDRSTQAFLDAMDADLLTTPKVSTGVEIEINKTLSMIEGDWEKHVSRVRKGMQVFDNKVKAALSVPLPAKYVGKRRPEGHKIPYRNSGDMVNAFQGSTISVWGDNSLYITIDTGIDNQHADWTNRNRTKAGENVRSVAWYHWADNIFGSALPAGTLHKKGIPDIRTILLGYYGSYGTATNFYRP